MEHLNGAGRSAESTDPQTSEHDCRQPDACSSGAAPATKTDTARPTPSEIADSPIESVSASSTLGEALKSFKKEATLSGSSQEVKRESSRVRRRGALTGLDIGESDVVLAEAESTTEWYKAIERRDCKALMELLDSEEGSALLLRTGKAGRTVLHVAAIQGSLELVNAIESGTIDFQIAQKLTDAIDGRCRLTASEIAVYIVGYKDFDYFKVSADRVHEKFPLNLDRLIKFWKSDYELTQVNLEYLELVITSVWEEGSANGRYEGLIETFEKNVDYNFYKSRLFLFHHACSGLDGGEFIQDVIKRFRDNWEEKLKPLRHLKGKFVQDVLKSCADGTVKNLMKLRDLQGRTPRHVAVTVTPVKVRDDLLESIRFSLAVKHAEDKYIRGGRSYWGVRDSRGWTPAHVAATQPWSESLGMQVRCVEVGDLEARNCPNSSEDSEEYCTALHLAVLHNNSEFVTYVAWSTEKCRWQQLVRDIYLDEVDFRRGRSWSVFSLALLLGNEEVAKSYAVMSGVPEKSGSDVIPPTCLAAALGNTNILRQLMTDSRFDPFERDIYGQTSLHYAANGGFELCNARYRSVCDSSELRTIDRVIEPREAHTYVWLRDVPNVPWLDARYGSSLQEPKIDKGFSGRKGCITMLLQRGLDVWQKDNEGKIADPGVRITDDEFIVWWHEKMAKETLEMRNNLNQGGNAISVIGALIATASYVGPLQPPLNYGADPSSLDTTSYAHVWDLPVKVFMMSNSLSFYLAIASIMLAVVPSLPMPQESVWKELERTRQTVAVAICVLLLSVVGILVSYAAASIAVMPKHTSFVNVCWTSYPAVVGGFACLIGIVLFIIRVLRLMYPAKCRWLGKVWEKVVAKVLRGVFWLYLRCCSGCARVEHV